MRPVQSKSAHVDMGMLMLCGAAVLSLALPTSASADYPRQTVSYVCDTRSDRLLITYSVDYESKTNHNPRAGIFDPEHLVARSEDSEGRFTLHRRPVRRTCTLGSRTFDIVFEGDFWANPMGQCGAVPYPAVTIRRGSRVVIPRTPLDNCFERTVVASITVRGRTEEVIIQEVSALDYQTLRNRLDMRR